MSIEQNNPAFTNIADRALHAVVSPDDIVQRLVQADFIRGRYYMGEGCHSTVNSIDRARGILTHCWGDAVVIMLASDDVAHVEDGDMVRPVGLDGKLEISNYERMEGLKIHGHSRLKTDENPAEVLSFLFDLQAINPKHYTTARTSLGII